MTTATTNVMHLITEMLQKQHPEVTYLKQDGIALALSKGLSETFLAKPKNPVEYFAKALLGQAQSQRGH